VRKSGCVVKDAVVLVDRLEGGKATLAAARVRLISFTSIEDLVGMLHDQKRITKADLQVVQKELEGRSR